MRSQHLIVSTRRTSVVWPRTSYNVLRYCDPVEIGGDENFCIGVILDCKFVTQLITAADENGLTLVCLYYTVL